MDNLEFEVSSASGIKYDTESISVNENKSDIDEKSMIEFSAKLMDFFKNTVRQYNKSYPNNKTTAKKIKEVYIEAANLYERDYPCSRNNWCIAKVFLFLDIKSGNKIQLNDGYANIDFENCINVSPDFFPSENNFKTAASIIEEKELDYTFESIDNLYLEDYMPMNFIWE